MKQRNFAGDYTQVQERAFLPTGGIPSKLNKNKHVLVYLWTESGSSIYKLGEVTSSGHGLTPKEAFENRYKDKSAILVKKQVCGLFVIPKNKEERGYDERIRRFINCHNGKNEIKFFCPGDDGVGNTERIENFNINVDLPKLIEIIENFCGISSSLMTEFTYRNDTQENIVEDMIDILEKTGRCLFNAHTAFGKSTCTPHIISRLLKIGEIALFTSPAVETLDDFIIKFLTYAFKKLIKCFENKDIEGKSKHEILKMVEKFNKTHIIVFCLSVQNVRYNDVDGEEAELRSKFSFLKSINIRLWVRDEYHMQYNGVKTAKILKEIKSDMILDLTATTYRLLARYNDYSTEQVVCKDNLWASYEKNVNKNPDYKNYPDAVISCVSFEAGLSPEVKEIFKEIEEEYRAEKMFEIQNGQFVQISAIIETFKYISDEKIGGITKKNRHCALSDVSLNLKTFGLIRIPQGNFEFTAKEKCALLKDELNKVILRTLYKTAEDFLVGKKLYGTTALLRKWSKEASDKGCSSVCIITHEQLLTGTDIPPLSYAYLFDRITSVDVFVQFIGRHQREFGGKNICKFYIMCPGMHVEVSSMMYNAIKDKFPEDEKMQKLMYDNISLVYHLDGVPNQISFEDAIKNNNIMLSRSLDPVSDITTQYLAKFTGLAEFLSEYDAGKSIKDKFGNGKDSITQQTGGSVYVPSTEDPEDDDTGDGEGTEKQQQKRENVKFVNLSIMLRTVLALDVVNQQQSSLKQIWDTPLAKEWFKPEHLRLAKALFEFQGFFPSFSLWFEEKRTAIKSANVIDIVLDEHCFLNEKFLVGSGMVYVPRVFGEKLIEKVGQGNTFVVFNALNGMLPALLKIKYPNAKIVCIEHFSYFIKHLTNMGFETYLYTDKKWKTMKFDAAIMNPPYNDNLDLEFIESACKITSRVIVVHPAVSIISRFDKKFESFKKGLEGHVKSIKIFNGNPVFGIGLFYPCQIMEIDFTQTFKEFEVEYSLENNNSEKHVFKSLFDITKWGNVPEYYSIEKKVLEYCKKTDNSYNHASKKFNSEHFVGVAKVRGHVVADKMFHEDFYTFVPKNQITGSPHVLFSFEKKEQQLNFLNYLQGYFARFCLSITKTKAHCVDIQWKCIPYLPSYDEPWTEDRITKLFKITDAEWAFIKKVIPKYY